MISMPPERRDFTEEAVQAVTQLGLRRHVMGILDKAARWPSPSTMAVKFSLSLKIPADKSDRQGRCPERRHEKGGG